MDKLFLMSYSVFIVSILCLFSLYYFHTPTQYSIQELQSDEIKDFTFIGDVSDVSQSESVVFLDLAASCKISGAIFVDNSTSFSELLGKTVRVQGHIDRYQGERSYLFDEIKILE